jgi:hypothetical protein
MMAPVGQWAEHWPHRTQGDSANLMSPAGAMRVLMPRSKNDSAHTFCTSWQTTTHRPHLMHLAGSSTMVPVVASLGNWGTILS